MIICVTCRQEMICETTAVGFEFTPGHIYAGDTFKCPQCGALVGKTNETAYYDPDHVFRKEKFIQMDKNQVITTGILNERNEIETSESDERGAEEPSKIRHLPHLLTEEELKNPTKEMNSFSVLFADKSIVEHTLCGKKYPIRNYNLVAYFSKEYGTSVIEQLHEIFYLTQNSDAPWSKNLDRSLSVGDLVIDCQTDVIWMCASCGWEIYSTPRTVAKLVRSFTEQKLW